MPIAFQKVPWRDDVVCIRFRLANENSYSFVLDSISQLSVLHFCARSVFTSIFQGHVKVALSSWYTLFVIVKNVFYQVFRQQSGVKQ